MRQAHPVYRSVYRPNLFLGGDRVLMQSTILITVALVFILLSAPTVIAGLLLWAVLTRVLQQAAKADPLLRQVYLRHQRYLPRYAGRSTPWAVGRRT